MMPEAKPRILVLGIDGVGNSLMALPMLAAIRRRFPLAYLVACVNSRGNAEVFRGCGTVDDTTLLPQGEFKRFRFLQRLRRQRFDYAIIPFASSNWRGPLYGLLAGAKAIVRHAHPRRRRKSLALLVNRSIASDPALHDVEQNLNLLQVLAIAPKPVAQPFFQVTVADQAEAETLLASCPVDRDQDLIIIHPGVGKTSLGPAKCWPEASYRALYEHMRRNTTGRVVFLEGPGELGAATSLVDGFAPGKDGLKPPLLRVSSIGAAAAILKRSRAYVGSDSAFSHLAAAVGTPAVTIFGPADPGRVAPYGSRDLVATPRTACFPCYRYPWPAAHGMPQGSPSACRCINQVAVDSVFALVRTALGRAPLQVH